MGLGRHQEVRTEVSHRVPAASAAACVSTHCPDMSEGHVHTSRKPHSFWKPRGSAVAGYLAPGQDLLRMLGGDTFYRPSEEK